MKTLGILAMLSLVPILAQAQVRVYRPEFNDRHRQYSYAHTEDGDLMEYSPAANVMETSQGRIISVILTTTGVEGGNVDGIAVYDITTKGNYYGFNFELHDTEMKSGSRPGELPFKCRLMNDGERGLVVSVWADPKNLDRTTHDAFSIRVDDLYAWRTEKAKHGCDFVWLGDQCYHVLAVVCKGHSAGWAFFHPDDLFDASSDEKVQPRYFAQTLRKVDGKFFEIVDPEPIGDSGYVLVPVDELKTKVVREGPDMPLAEIASPPIVPDKPLPTLPEVPKLITLSDLPSAVGDSSFPDLQSTSVASMIGMLNGSDARLQHWAAFNLRYKAAEAKTAVTALAKALAAKDTDVRRAAAETLEQLGPVAKNAIPALRSLLNDRDVLVQSAAAAALEALTRDPAAAPTHSLRAKPRQALTREMVSVRDQVSRLQTAARRYTLNMGRPPRTFADLYDAPRDIDSGQWQGPYLLGELPKDPWGNDYLMITPGRATPNFVDIWSFGPDGIDGTDDDVGNWEPPDVELRDLRTSGLAAVAKPLTIEGTGLFTGLENLDIDLQLLVESTPRSGRMEVVATQTVQGAGAWERKLSFSYVPLSAGEYLMTLRAAVPLLAEVDKTNNEATTSVKVLAK